VATKNEIEQFEGEVLPGFLFKVVKIPPGLASTHPARERCDDRSIHVPKSAGSVWIEVWTSTGASLAASATFAADAEAVRCDTVDVMPDYRRLGIATVLYRLASELFEAPVVPSETLSEDARLFWGRRTSITSY